MVPTRTTVGLCLRWEYGDATRVTRSVYEDLVFDRGVQLPGFGESFFSRELGSYASRILVPWLSSDMLHTARAALRARSLVVSLVSLIVLT